MQFIPGCVSSPGLLKRVSTGWVALAQQKARLSHFWEPEVLRCRRNWSPPEGSREKFLLASPELPVFACNLWCSWVTAASLHSVLRIHMASSPLRVSPHQSIRALVKLGSGSTLTQCDPTLTTYVCKTRFPSKATL